MEKQEIVSKLWAAQLSVISEITPTELTNCRSAARMIRYAIKMHQMAKENLATNNSDHWRAIKASAYSLLEELVVTLPSMLFNIDYEIEKVDNVISLSEAIIEATKQLETEVLDDQKQKFEIVFQDSDFKDLI